MEVAVEKYDISLIYYSLYFSLEFFLGSPVVLLEKSPHVGFSRDISKCNIKSV